MNKIHTKKLQAFTLIELLVVITIIGILATIVVVNLNTTRGRGQDVAVKEQMSQIRAASELYYDDGGRYGYSVSPVASVITGNCLSGSSANSIFANTYFADTDFVRSVVGIKRNSSTDPLCTIGTGSINAQSWAVVTKLRLSSGYWCVDSYGNSLEITGSTAVSGNNAQCPSS